MNDDRFFFTARLGRDEPGLAFAGRINKFGPNQLGDAFVANIAIKFEFVEILIFIFIALPWSPLSLYLVSSQGGAEPNFDI
jgi:hypothetical protein